MAPAPKTPAEQSKAVDKAAEPDPTAKRTVPESALPNPTAPRFPGGINLKMLDNPPVPAERTTTQVNEDLDAAMTVLDIARTQTPDSDALDNWFPKIKERFRLTSIGYEGDFSKGFEIVAEINPKRKVDPKEPLSGTGLPAALVHATKVTPTTANLGGDTVGVKMEARPLGPDHPEGSGPSGQKNLMDKLPTGYEINDDAQSNFVRGHLLNDWLGGAGKDYNLFPITEHANRLHNSGIEQEVKKWVNEKRFWVNYDVSVKIDKVHFDPKDIADSYVNSTLTAKGSVLNTSLKAVDGLTREVTISSTFKMPAKLTPTKTEDPAKLNAQKARVEDLARTVLGTSRSTSAADLPEFPQEIEDKLTAAVKTYKTKAKVSELLEGHPGMGPGLSVVLWQVYDAKKNKTDRVLSEDAFPSETRGLFKRILRLWNEGMSKKI
jgi:hypothetical protein